MRYILIALLLSFSAIAYSAQTYQGKVVGISDGDTITVLDQAKQQHKVRLAEIDAPEKAQPYGQKSKQVLSSLIFSKTVTVKVQTIDRYNREIGQIYHDNAWINKIMIEQGAAWVYTQYSTSPELKTVQAIAKSQRVGLWSLPESETMPPWEYRKSAKKPANSSTQSAAQAPQSSSEFSCSARKICKQMVSCEEARYHLTTCGNTRLDRNNDGVPCETICK